MSTAKEDFEYSFIPGVASQQVVKTEDQLISELVKTCFDSMPEMYGWAGRVTSRVALDFNKVHSTARIFCAHKEGDNKRFLDLLKDLGFRPYLEGYTQVGKITTIDFVRNHAEFIRVNFRGHFESQPEMFDVTAAILNKEDLLKIIQVCNDIRVKEEPKGSLYALMRDDSGKIYPTLMGDDYLEIERENYSQQVLDAYDKTIKEFNSETPCGTISIFSGEPGTGKTFLIRSILGNVENAQFLYMPADIIRSASGPELLSVLKSMTDNLKEDLIDSMAGEEYVAEFPQTQTAKPKLIIILEDADLVLAPRQDTDVSGVSVLLNLTDGIIGKLLNIRIVATTNSPAKTLDKAILRRGRKCTDVIVDKLNREQASKVYSRLGGKKELPENKSGYALCDLYYYAKNEDEEFFEKSKKIGF